MILVVVLGSLACAAAYFVGGAHGAYLVKREYQDAIARLLDDAATTSGLDTGAIVNVRVKRTAYDWENDPELATTTHRFTWG